MVLVMIMTETDDLLSRTLLIIDQPTNSFHQGVVFSPQFFGLSASRVTRYIMDEFITGYI